MTVTIAQMNSVIGDFAANADRVVELTRRAIAGGNPGGSEGGVASGEGASGSGASGGGVSAGGASGEGASGSGAGPSGLVVFPELCLCGYPPMDLLDQDSFTGGCLAALRRLQAELPRGIAVAVGHVDRNRTGSGKTLQNVISVILDGEIVFSQAKTLLPTYEVFDEARYFEPAAERRVYRIAGERVGFPICEDIWWEAPPSRGFRYTIDPVKELLDAGATMLVVPSASPFVAGKLSTRLALAAGAAREGGIPVLYCNAVGANDSLVFDGRSFAVDPEGALVSMCGWDEELLRLDVPVRSGGAGKDDAPARPGDAATAVRAGAMTEEDRMEELHRAIVAGIRDYMRKSGFGKAVLGLSGGIDSALVAVLAAEAVGAANVTCVTMPSRFSSEGSVDDSIELCRRAGMPLERLPIEGPFRAYLDLLAVPFAGRPFDLAEENLQARIRGSILMAWSNKFGSLLLTTGNKSEIAAGYCTLYGDMCGALAPIGDLYKTEVYALSRHLNRVAAREGRPEPIPLPVIDKAPSAELRHGQTDQDSLPPYEMLDGILRLYVEGGLSAREIAARGFDPATVERVVSMTARAEYKRRQAAPVIKVSARAFGIGRRLPLARAIHEARV